MNILFKTLLTFLLLTLSSVVLAQEGGGGMTNPIDASGTEGQMFVAVLMGFLTLIASLLGIILIFQGILKLFNYHKNPNDPKTSVKAILVTFFAGALLTNSFGTAGILITSITGSSGYCFNYAGNMTGDIKLSDIHSDACFDPDSSEITETLRESLTVEGDAAWVQFRSRIMILFAVIQLIGFYYFIKAIMLLKGNADGKNDTGIGKILVMMVFSAIAMDLDTGLTIVINTIVSLGLGGS